MRLLMRHAAQVLLATLALCACAPDAEVDHRGQYVFFPGNGAAATDPRPLRELLILEHDASGDFVLCTLLRGQLSVAGIGLPDLRSVAARHGGYELLFQQPLSRYAQHARELGEAGDAGDASGARVALTLGDGAVTLHALDADTLGNTGASRWLRTLSSADFRVEAFVGVLDEPGDFGGLTLDGDAHALDARLQRLLPSAPEVEFDEMGERLQLALGASPADYVQVELAQLLERLPDALDAGVEAQPDAMVADAGAPEAAELDLREALVRTTLAPAAAYEAPLPVLTDALGQGCWSSDAPLLVRVIQVARDYVMRRGGDLAVITQRSDTASLPAASWAVAPAQEGARADYCASYILAE